jgi:DNA-binding transcriptional LysR family regulator
MINLHYVELFYYLARYGGVTEAVRNMPYGIQQCTMSRQLIELEKLVGTRLFERRPFQLTPAGERLFRCVRPFIEDLEGVLDELRGGLPDLVRLAAPPITLRDYLPPMLRAVRESFPQLRFTLKEGMQCQIRQWFEARLIDLAVTMTDGSPFKDCCWETLLRLPLVLLVTETSPVRSAGQLLRPGHRDETLIGPGPDDAISRCLRQGLLARGIDWRTGIEANAIELVESYVLQGFGVGVSVTVPGRTTTAGLRVLPVTGFPPVEVGIVWRRNPNKVMQALMDQIRQEAQRLAA